MKRESVDKTTKLGLCTSCGVCKAVCPTGAIDMKYNQGQYTPIVDSKKCIDCGLCLDLCTGIDVDPDKIRYKEYQKDVFDGPYFNCYSSYSKDINIRKNAVSGGMITSLVKSLFESSDYDVAFLLRYDSLNKNEAKLNIVNKADEVYKYAKSKYIPASVENIVIELKKREHKKYIIVGTACQISGIIKYIDKFKLSRDNILFLGLVCDKTLNFNYIKYLKDKYSDKYNELIKIDFRSKVKDGWPGDSRLYYKSGVVKNVSKKVRMDLKEYFQLKRCLYCIDKLNRSADIVFGDCYVAGQDSYFGKSSIIIRTEKGKRLLDKHKDDFNFEEADLNQIKDSQYIQNKKNNLNNINILNKKHNLYKSYENNKVSIVSKVKLLLKLRHVKLGIRYRLKGIKLSIWVTKAKQKFKSSYRDLNKLILSIVILWVNLIFTRGAKKGGNVEKRVKDVTVVGVETTNRGSQAMLFRIIDIVKSKDQTRSINLLSLPDYKRTDREKEKYNINIFPWEIEIKLVLLSPYLGKLFRKYKYKSQIKNIREAIKNSSCIVDSSGFALSSKHTLAGSLNYLLNIAIAKKYDIDYYILPQSFGPFKYSGVKKAIIIPLIKKYLKYPQELFVRERKGKNDLDRIGVKKSKLRYDIVLWGNNMNPDNIFINNHEPEIINIKDGSIGIIPNSRVFDRVSTKRLIHLYKIIISYYLNQDKNVYIIKYSDEDYALCESIKNLFINETRVIFIDTYLDTIETEMIVKKLSAIITSRYHSVIHAYKHSVPAFVIGWADKYNELLKVFEQDSYIFNCRDMIDDDDILTRIVKLNNRIDEDKKIINEKYCEIIKNKDALNEFKVLYELKKQG